jgi:hypothetical protein
LLFQREIKGETHDIAGAVQRDFLLLEGDLEIEAEVPHGDPSQTLINP